MLARKQNPKVLVIISIVMGIVLLVVAFVVSALHTGSGCSYVSRINNANTIEAVAGVFGVSLIFVGAVLHIWIPTGLTARKKVLRTIGTFILIAIFGIMFVAIPLSATHGICYNF